MICSADLVELGDRLATVEGKVFEVGWAACCAARVCRRGGTRSGGYAADGVCSCWAGGARGR